MTTNTAIEWADHTFNPWTGCTKISPACDHCYAEGWAKRSGHVQWGPHADRRRTSVANWNMPKRWNDQAAAFMNTHGRRQRVFCASLADVFDNAAPDEWRHDLFNLIAATPDLDWLLLTKRPQNICRMVMDHGCVAGNGRLYLPANVWLGTTVEDQRRANQNIPALLRTIGMLGVRTTFLSVEPMLSPVDVFSRQTGELLHTSGNGYEPGWISWIICGGESGPGARPMHPDWTRSLRDQCARAAVPFLFKQWGEWAPHDRGRNNSAHLATPGALDEPLGKFGKKLAGRLLDGRTWDGSPL